ncbi:hypothetical protein [Sphingomonas desiccabilis]|uniref:hypothetical protein n=1 Tax=Sphingomonas desiccabilis TaxID=429134 RepID=UPI0017F39D12|nr:hypothetical protein [Sphingomonas desiccabilis]MBB3910839.1 hypothetical protein [Sphingomonas desiccabilis]
MSKRLEVLAAVKALVQSALPHVKVIGLDGEDAAPMRVPPTGMVVVRSGDPGEPEVDLCPPVYHYTHRIPIEVSAYETTAESGEEIVDRMMGLIGGAVEANRTLGGLCDWLEPTGPNTDDIYTEAATPARGGDFDLVASYSTTSPLN